MRVSGIKIIFVFIAFIASVALAEEIKEPNVAGSFYPDNPRELSQMIDTFLNAANPQPMPGSIFALILPHAGYGYSGQTAAFGYKLIKDKPYRTVVVIGVKHAPGFSGIYLYPQGRFCTPLGDIEIDKKFAGKLLYRESDIFSAPAAFAGEHSVEVQLPFLQQTLKDFEIVPILMNNCSYFLCQKLADLLKEAIGKRQDVLVIASTDMYHGGDYQALEAADNLTISCLKKMDSAGLYEGLIQDKMQLCGGFGVVTTLILAKELGHNKLEVLNYTNSAQVVGQKSNWMVGYVSCAIDQEAEGAMLNKDQRKRLLEIARKSIQGYLSTGKKMAVSETDPLLLQEMGAFVTLHNAGELRGCIGSMQGRQPLYLTIRDMAIEATQDPRFVINPVTFEELKDIEIEISALSPLKKIDSVDEIEMGKHGVLVQRGFQGGVYLPQVATETGWSKEEFLSSLCSHKAGLSADAWKDKSTEIYIFTAVVFSEKNY